MLGYVLRGPNGHVSQVLFNAEGVGLRFDEPKLLLSSLDDMIAIARAVRRCTGNRLTVDRVESGAVGRQVWP